MNNHSRPAIYTEKQYFTEDERQSDIFQIGVALGSPTQALHLESYERFHPQTRTVISAANSQQVDEEPHLSRSRSKRWAFLSRSKSKRHLKHDVDVNLRPRPAVVSNPLPPSSSPATSSLISRSFSFKSKKKPSIVRSPMDPVSDTRGQYPPRTVSLIDSVEGSQAYRSKLPKTKPYWMTVTSNAISDSPMIDLEIPHIEMERYSIMFSNVLKRQQSTSALLNRRHADIGRLGRLRLVDLDASDQQIANVTTNASSHFPKPVTSSSPRICRSFTNLALRPGLSVDLLNPKGDAEGEMDTTLQHWNDTRSPCEAQTLLRSKLSTTLEPFPIHSPLEIESEISNESFLNLYRDSKDDTEPDCEADVLSNRSYSSGTNEAKHHNLYTSDERDSPVNIYEASIARQISVSRQQRKMLEPLREPTDRHVGTKRVSATTRPAVNTSQRLAETKASTPTLVHAGADSYFPTELYRRSEQVILESL